MAGRFGTPPAGAGSPVSGQVATPGLLAWVASSDELEQALSTSPTQPTAMTHTRASGRQPHRWLTSEKAMRAEVFVGAAGRTRAWFPCCGGRRSIVGATVA